MRDVTPNKDDTGWVLYISTGTETSPGKVYQVDENGRQLGKVNLPYTATGMVLHRTHGLVLAVPRDGGKIMQIDDTGKVLTLLERDPSLPHPTDVGIAGESDSVVVADNIANQLAATTVGGVKPKVYQRFEGQKYTAQDMSVAVTNDKHVIFSSNADPGVRMYGGDQSASKAEKPILPNFGRVAADPKSLRWAASQEPNLVYVFEGQEVVKKLRLPAGKTLYRNGLLSFSMAGSLCVACKDSDQQVGDVRILMYDIEKDQIRSLFPWKEEQMTDFVVGPRMRWDRKSPSVSKTTF